MERTGEFIRGVVFIVAFIILVCIVAWRWLKGSRDEPFRLVAKWIISGLVIAFLIFGVVPGVMGGGAGALMVPLIAVCGLVLAILWTPNITAFLARPFGNLID